MKRHPKTVIHTTARFVMHSYFHAERLVAARVYGPAAARRSLSKAVYSDSVDLRRV